MKLQTEYDVVVIGAGIAGIGAAVKAGQTGCSVLLVEQYGFVGGMSTAGMVSPFMKHEVNGEPLVQGVFADIETDMRQQHGMINNGFSASSFRFASFHLLKKAGVVTLLNTIVSSVTQNNDTIECITIFTAGTEITVKGNVFIDTSGDAQLLFLGNFPSVKGDEKTGKLQALTLFFRMGNINIENVLGYAQNNNDDFFDWMDVNANPSGIVSVAGYFRAVKKAIREHRLAPEVQYIFFTTLPGSGEGSFNTSNILGLDGSSSLDLTYAECIGRNQVHQVVTILKNEIPGFEAAYLIETAPQVGIRETRRAVGDYIVTGDDIRRGARFTDAIARGCYGIDIHGQQDENSVMEHIPEGAYYEIPMRALLVQQSTNVLAAGRCISSTREGHSALRIQPTCAATGEACGALAALAATSHRSVREVDYHEVQYLISYKSRL